jgi:hypothetical protein
MRRHGGPEEPPAGKCPQAFAPWPTQPPLVPTAYTTPPFVVGIEQLEAHAVTRHSSLNRTMNVYADPSLLDVAGALEPLPEVEVEEVATEARATRRVVALQ